MKISFLKLPKLLIILLFMVNCASSQEDIQQETPHDMADENGTKSEEQVPDEDIPDSASYTTVVEEYGQLSVEGNKMVDQNGNPAQLRGMSFFWSQWIGKYYTNETVQWLKEDWHCTVVRAAMAIDYDGYLTNPEVEKQKVMTVIDAAIEHGIYVIIDWHDHEAENHLEESLAFFGEMAETYGSYPNVIYEPYNEPLDVSWRNVLKPYHEAVIAEIRKHDTDNLIICGTPNWSQDVEDVIVARIDDPNIMYTLHYYAATHKQELRDKALLAIANSIPIFVTEYGVTQASGDESIDAPEAELWWNFLDNHKISYLNWSIADKEELSAALKPGASVAGGWSEEELTISGSMVRNEIRKKNKAY